MKKLVLSIVALVTTCVVSAQKEKIVKKIPATRTTQKIVIDGDISDEAWKTAPLPVILSNGALRSENTSAMRTGPKSGSCTMTTPFL